MITPPYKYNNISKIEIGIMPLKWKKLLDVSEMRAYNIRERTEGGEIYGVPCGEACRAAQIVRVYSEGCGG
jgi:hypothetical protein